MKTTVMLYLCALLMLSCNGSGSDEPVTLPSNLVVNVEVSSDGSGQVSLTATATNANFYTIYFGEPGTSSIKSPDGKADYTYSSSGTFTIHVQANATASQFIDKETEITINLLADGEVNIPDTGYESPTTYPGLSLVWEDDFSGTSLSSANWTAELGRGTNGWGNNELQYYRKENTEVRDGYLIITAKKENFSDAQYTSSRLITKDKQAFQYGRIDIRAVLPKGQGIWPALWMLGSNISSVGWPKSGEIDIMELVGGSGNKDKTVYSTLHWDNAGTHACTCGDNGFFTLPSGTFADEFHVFSIVWNASTITSYVDNVQFHVVDISPAELSEFDNPFFLIFNVAVGGNWPGSPDGTTVFPQHMIVDYVRVFQ